MIEKLSLDFVRKIYNILTTGNDDVNFYCMCLQNQNREAATNNPVKFGLELIKINILCRLPFCNKRIFTKTAYANGDYLEYAYDNYGNISVITGETGKIAEMIYNKQGLVTKAVDYSSGETSYYYYTFDGSLESEYRTSSAVLLNLGNIAVCIIRIII